MRKSDAYIHALPALWSCSPLRLVQLPSGKYVIHFLRNGVQVEHAAIARITRAGVPPLTTIVTRDGEHHDVQSWLYPCNDEVYDPACEHTQEQVLALLAPLGLAPTFTRDITRFED